jgi:hypothetical protein
MDLVPKAVTGRASSSYARGRFVQVVAVRGGGEAGYAFVKGFT